MDERAALLQAILDMLREMRRDLGETHRDLGEGRAGLGGLLAMTRDIRATVADCAAICDRLDAKLDVIDEQRRIV